MIETDRADHSWAKLDHKLFVSITRTETAGIWKGGREHVNNNGDRRGRQGAADKVWVIDDDVL